MRLSDVDEAFSYGASVLEGELVRLRGLRDEDLPRLAAWEMDAGRLATLSDSVLPPSEAKATEALAAWCANGKGGDAGFAIETQAGPPTLIGMVHLSGIRAKDRCASLGIALDRDQLGRGYGTDALRVLAGFAFRELGLHRLQLTVIEFNEAGIRAYAKAGFTEEGRRREAVWHDGVWYDEVLMALLDHEWSRPTP